MQEGDDGTITVEYFFTNISSVSADSIDVWVHICDTCSFTKEPEGFDKPAGSNEQTRHRMLASINPGVSFQKSSVTFKPPTPLVKGKMFQLGISFSYSCKNCGGRKDTSDFVISVISPVRAIPPVSQKKLHFQ